MDTRTVCDLGLIEAAAYAAPVFETQLSHTDENWKALPDRLRGRGDYLRDIGREKDAELMYDAATEIDGLRAMSSNAGAQATARGE